MKETRSCVLKEAFNWLIWMLMTIVSFIKTAFNFIYKLFFYQNIPIDLDILNNDIQIDNKKKINAINNEKIEFREEKEKPKEPDIIPCIEIETETDSYIDIEEEREKIKKELQQEDEKDLIKTETPKNKSEKLTKDASTNSKTEETGKTISKDAKVTKSNEDYSNKKNKSHKKNLKKQNKDQENEENSKEKDISQNSNSDQSETNENKSANQIAPEMLEKREDLIRELATSEDQYCENIELLLEIYRSKLTGIIDKETDDYVFGNVSQLMILSNQLSDLFHKELNKGANKAEIWKCFPNVSQTMKTFLPFLEHYKKSMTTFKKMFMVNFRFKIMMKKIASMNQNYRFQYIYRLPGQRMESYSIKLLEILKSTPEWHSDFKKLPTIIDELNETTSMIEKQCKENENIARLQKLEKQIIDCPSIVSNNRYCIKSFKLIDWKKFYILNDMLLIVRGKRLRKEIKIEDISSIWLDSNTGTVHLSIPNKKNVRIRGGIKGNAIYTILKKQINKENNELPPQPTKKHESYMFRKSDLVRTNRFSSSDESSINSDTESQSLTVPFYSNNSDTNSSINSNFANSKNNNLLEENFTDSDDGSTDSDSESNSNGFTDIPDLLGNIENSEPNLEEDELNEIVPADHTKVERFSEDMLIDRKTAIQSLIESEEEYQKNLYSLINIYKPRFSKSILNEKTEQTVFGNILPLIVISEQYTDTLEDEIKKGADKAEIWKCFTHTPDSKKFIQSYKENFTSMLSHYNSFVLSDKKIKKFVKKINDENPDNRFTSLSIVPFIRMTSLIQQLQTICHSTPKWHPDFDHLPNMINEIKKNSLDSNKKCTEAENISKVIQIEINIIDCPSLLSENRKFLQEFTLDDKAGIFVFNDMIVFSRSNKKYKYSMRFADIDNVANKRNSILITMSDGKSHSIKSNDQTENIYDFIKTQKDKQNISGES